MDVIVENIGWIFMLLTVAFIFLYKKISGRADAITSRFVTLIPIDTATPDSSARILQALKNSGFRKVGHDPEMNRFYAQSKVSFYSWGEYIQLEVAEDEGKQLEFTSVCALPTQIMDWGKNRRNAKKFIKELNRLKQIG